MVYHSVVLNVGSSTSNCSIDIMQGDTNSHQLLIKLTCCGAFYNISGYEPELTFYDATTETVVLTTAVNVLNDYRGYLSYVIGPRMLQNYGRYTVTLRLKQGNFVKQQCNFVLNVTKNQGCTCGCCDDVEVTISKEFYDEIRNHIDDTSIHISESDKAALDWLSDNLGTLVVNPDSETPQSIYDIIKTSPEFREQVTEICKDLVDSGTLSQEISDQVLETINPQVEEVQVKVDQLDTKVSQNEDTVEGLSQEVREIMSGMSWVTL